MNKPQLNMLTLIISAKPTDYSSTCYIFVTVFTNDKEATGLRNIYKDKTE